MQASTAKNETRLPRAVLKISDAVKAGIDARAALKTQQNPATGAQPPAADPVDPNPPANPAPPADPRENDIDYWRHLAKSTAGRLKVAGEERRAEADEFRRQITELQGQVRSLQATPSASAEVDLTGLLTPEQIDLLGEDEAKAVARAAMSAAQRVAKEAIDAEIQPLKDAAKANKEQESKDRQAAFVDELTALVPTWREVNADAGFLEWLGANDEEKQGRLDKFAGQLNAIKVAGLFKEFLKTKERPVPPVAPNGTGATGGADAQPQQPAGAGGPPTKAEIDDFYKRSATRRRGQPGYVTDEERTKFEARLRLPRPPGRG
jgi:hypothetical protein